MDTTSVLTIEGLAILANIPLHVRSQCGNLISVRPTTEAEKFESGADSPFISTEDAVLCACYDKAAVSVYFSKDAVLV